MSAGNAEVLVVGAGPVGLTMAAALNHHGISCRIIDKAAEPSDKTKALAVWCRSLELMADLGLADTFVNDGLKISGASIFAEGKRIVHLHLTSDESAYGFGLMIPQCETERLLTTHLAGKGIHIERQVELIGLSEQADGVSCTLKHADGAQEDVQVPWLLGCDGAHSTVRHALNLEFPGYADPTSWMIADVSIEGPLATDEVSVFWRQEKAIVFFPYGGTRFRMIADLTPEQEVTVQDEVTLPFAQAVADTRGPGGLTLADPIWLTTFKINERKVAEYRHGRVMVAGDAAHIHSPAGGQGMNTGMQDAFNLAWKLALVQRGQGLAEPLLESYSVERSAVGDQVLKNASRFTTIATLHNPVALWLRNHIVPILGSFNAIQEKIRDSFFELSINYRNSPLTGETWPLATKGLAVGDRLCDVPLRSAVDGQRTTMFAAIRGPEHALLLLPGSDDAESVAQLAAIADDTAQAFPDIVTYHLVVRADSATSNPRTGVWIDVDGQAYERLGAHQPTLVLVRPDGYIGYRCQPADGEQLRTYMSRYLVSQANDG